MQGGHSVVVLAKELAVGKPVLPALIKKSHLKGAAV